MIGVEHPVPAGSIEPDDWPLRHFTPHELASPDDDMVFLHVTLIEALALVRQRLDVPMIIRSAYRSAYYNAEVGGSERSLHMRGRAVDVALEGARFDLGTLVEEARLCGFRGFGFYSDFLHIDTGRPRMWVG